MLILHGDNQVASRQALLTAKEGKQILEFSGSDITVNQLHHAVSTNSLFGQANTIVIERAFAKKDIADYLVQNQEADIIIWEPKDVSAKVKDFKNVQKFDLSKHIFLFLDSPLLSSLHLALSTAPAEVVFASLVTRSYKRTNTKWLASLLDLDFKLKSGALPYDLATALELWCAKL